MLPRHTAFRQVLEQCISPEAAAVSPLILPAKSAGGLLQSRKRLFAPARERGKATVPRTSWEGIVRRPVQRRAGHC